MGLGCGVPSFGWQTVSDTLNPQPAEPKPHEWDDDGCCLHCGFDGAEWHWWRFSTYEGRAQPEARMPACREAK